MELQGKLSLNFIHLLIYVHFNMINLVLFPTIFKCLFQSVKIELNRLAYHKKMMTSNTYQKKKDDNN